MAGGGWFLTNAELAPGGASARAQWLQSNLNPRGNKGGFDPRRSRICCLIPRVGFWVLVPHLRRGGEVVGERRVGTFLQMSRGGGEGFEIVA
jgi:hypothetical protein